MNAMEQSLFNAGVKGELRTAGIISDTTTEGKAEDMATLYMSEWLKTDAGDKLFSAGGVVECLVDFKAWLATNPTVETSTITPVNITVCITIPVGDKGANVQLSLAAIPGGDMNASIIEAYDMLVEAGNQFRAKRLGKTGTTSGSDTQGNPTTPSTETIDIHTVKVEDKNGKRYYRCAGGRWQKFGVAAWKEVWDAAGYDVNTFEVGDNPVKFKAELQLDATGKPEKVKRIIPA